MPQAVGFRHSWKSWRVITTPFEKQWKTLEPLQSKAKVVNSVLENTVLRSHLFIGALLDVHPTARIATLGSYSDDMNVSQNIQHTSHVVLTTATDDGHKFQMC